MSRLRVHRFTTIVLVMVSLLFAQLALAQYVCPVTLDEEAQVAMEMAPGMPCEQMDHSQAVQPALCHHHCTNAAQSFEPVKVPTLSLPAVVQVLVVPLVVDRAQQQAVAFAH